MILRAMVEVGPAHAAQFGTPQPRVRGELVENGQPIVHDALEKAGGVLACNTSKRSLAAGDHGGLTAAYGYH
ncbi:hypothetical protein [Actinoplanes sp. NPDC049681]|uniref:hypothetical protein n=1 Tax=Actinoplanes sp. NPDC049681 TaxID=3363905 RepID=UPI0037B08CE2